MKPLRQVVTATADGALAATELEKYVAELQRKTGLRSSPAPVDPEKGTQVPSAVSGDLFDEKMRGQLKELFSKMEGKLLLRLYPDNRPISKELETFIRSLVSMTDKLSVEVADPQEDSSVAPCVRVCREDGSEIGLAFHGIPSGHEFTSFVLGLYNAAGPGQPLDEETKTRIQRIQQETDLQIFVTLSCNMCPDLVLAAQRIAAVNPKVTAEVYDIHHFEAMKERYQIMSVPCMVVNHKHVSFGKKSIHQILDMMESQADG